MPITNVRKQSGSKDRIAACQCGSGPLSQGGMDIIALRGDGKVLYDNHVVLQVNRITRKQGKGRSEC